MFLLIINFYSVSMVLNKTNCETVGAAGGGMVRCVELGREMETVLYGDVQEGWRHGRLLCGSGSA